MGQATGWGGGQVGRRATVGGRFLLHGPLRPEPCIGMGIGGVK